MSRPDGNDKAGWLLPCGQSGDTLLKQVRLKHGLVSARAAALIGMSPGHYSNLENGQRKVTSLVLPKLEVFLGELGYDESVRQKILR